MGMGQQVLCRSKTAAARGCMSRDGVGLNKASLPGFVPRVCIKSAGK